MGIGDQLLAAGLARGAKDRGRRIAFGDGKKIIWDKNSPIIFSKNKNIAVPGSEADPDIEWIPFYRGNRLYNAQGAGRWIWNMEFKATPGEIYFHHNEQQFARSVRPGFVLIEPNVPWYKSVAPNKDWGAKNYQAVAEKLRLAGHQIAQPSYGKVRINGASVISTASFRHAAIALSRASLYIGPEGGLHHAAAATKLTEGDHRVISEGTKAVVLFGGFIPPQVTGYDTHINLTGGTDEACGSLIKCEHCRKAMSKISVEEVVDSALKLLKGKSG